jgi:putative spermidine/putrescine transport system ATP-binding protein
MMLRPERLRILDGSETEAMNRFDGKVLSAIYQGDTLLLQLVLERRQPGQPAHGDARRRCRAARSGSPIAVGIAVSDTVLLADEGRARP